MPKGPKGEKRPADMIADCILCGGLIADKPHEHHWKHIPQWNVTICETCKKGNWDGIVLEQHPRLIAHLKSIGIEIKYNAKGWVDIPH